MNITTYRPNFILKEEKPCKVEHAIHQKIRKNSLEKSEEAKEQDISIMSVKNDYTDVKNTITNFNKTN